MSMDPLSRLDTFADYELASREFSWRFPPRFNLAAEICRRHPDAVTRIALFDVKFAGFNTYTFGGLDYLSDKLAVVLMNRGIRTTDRVALAVPQSAAFIVSLLGILKLGGTAVIFPNNAPDQLSELVSQWNVSALIAEYDLLEQAKINSGLVFTLAVGHRGASAFADFLGEITRSPSTFSAVELDSESPAVIAVTKPGLNDGYSGVMHTQRSLLGSLPGFQMATEFASGDESVFWTPDPWAPAALLRMVLPALWFGSAVVSLDRALPSGWLDAIERFRVTDAWLSSADLEMLRMVFGANGSRDVCLRRVVSDTPLESGLRRWCENALSASAGTVYGPLEAPAAIATCSRWFQTREGWVGRAAPGFSVDVIDSENRIVEIGKQGRLAIAQNSAPIGSQVDASGVLGSHSQGWLVIEERAIKDDAGNIWVG